MKRKLVSVLLVAAMGVSVLAGCGSSNSGKTDEEKKAAASDENVLEFYHGYYQDKSEWAAAQVMRDIYDEFAKAHADGTVTFKPIPVENRDDIVSAKVAGGSFPDMVDVGGAGVPQSAISQNLVYDLKPYIDENKLQDAVGLNYTQHDMDGHIYAVHDQIESRGLWYNSSIFEKAGVSADALKDWNSFGEAMTKISALNDGTYGYIGGQGSSYIVNSIMASTENGKKMLESELTEETINSDEFANAFKTAAKLDQANGSDHTTDDNGNLMAEFNTNGKVGVLFNGVWNASGIDASLVDSIEPSLFPGNVAIASAGGGLAVSNKMSDEKTKLALEFIKYMTSKEVQEKIFTQVQANPCNTTVDLNALAKKSGDAATIKLAKACSEVNSADTVVIDMNYTWGSDVDKAIINALMECAVSGTDVDARFESLKKELLALIG
ncbi:ABC transporter substrate-binding protein [Lachnoanaerobaculum gingivalis]|uniref:ABC transporter substrate-binding protein n=1 Tax=Lachnoanaerobaculum gingivalis TaxID=2490855 RepID=UPI0028D5E488|nr:ABC transporter substrate-binding protein [Lachnoanaerobaculum gingivalis]